MATPYACADLGVDCPGKFTTETEEELWKHLDLHADEVHPGFEMTQQAREQISGAIKSGV